MKLKSLIIALFALAVLASCQPGATSRNENLTTASDSASYAIGVLVGEQNKQQLDASFSEGEFSIDLLIASFEKTLKGEETKMTSEVARTFIQKYFQEVAEKKANENVTKGEAFLEENKAKEGVTTLESGLQYEVLVEGTGAKPALTDKVKCHYHGTLMDGKVFDSSVDKGEPVDFPVNGVIPGWTEALQLMPVGSKWKLYIPGALAYGERGAGADIGPNATLIFEVELLEIVK